MKIYQCNLRGGNIISKAANKNFKLLIKVLDQTMTTMILKTVANPQIILFQTNKIRNKNIL